jgi:serine/threonine-protein kinase
MDDQRPGFAADSVDTYQFADIVIDAARRDVRRSGAPIRLGKLTYELLLLLVESSPNVVTREDVAKRLWNGRPVTSDTIRQRVKLLRKALGDNADNPRYLSVVRGQGYRIIPNVVLSASAPETIPTWPRRRLVAAGLLFTIGVALLSAYQLDLGNGEELNSSLDSISMLDRDKSIAILPFESLATNSDDLYFVDGIHNDLLTQLAKIGSLRVISRTSVLEYQDHKKNLRIIGDELNVATILEGSVQRSGESVRINVQLIDAESDEHVWAERYDRKLTAQNLFEIQTEIATAVANQLQAILSSDDLVRLEERPTENTLAYNYFLIGNARTRRTMEKQTPPGAIDAYRRAVAEDPQFALAWAALSRSQSARYAFVDRTDDSLELARQSVERAFALNPNLPEAHLAMAYYYYRGFHDYNAALQELAIAEQGMPGDALIHTARAQITAEMGDLQQSMISRSKVIELDPRNVQQLQLLGFAHARLHNYQQAESIFDRAIEIDPDNAASYQFKANNILWRDGDSASARELLASAPIKNRFHEANWRLSLYERDFDAALAYLDDWPMEVIDLQRLYMPKDWFYGITHELAGSTDEATRYFSEARAKIGRKMKSAPEDSRVLVAYADVLAHQGEHESAIAYAHRALVSTQMTKGKRFIPGIQLNAVMTFVAAEEFNTAVTMLDEYLSSPQIWSAEGLLPDPRFDVIRDDPAFTAVAEKYRRQ